MMRCLRLTLVKDFISVMQQCAEGTANDGERGPQALKGPSILLERASDSIEGATVIFEGFRGSCVCLSKSAERVSKATVRGSMAGGRASDAPGRVSGN